MRKTLRNMAYAFAIATIGFCIVKTVKAEEMPEDSVVETEEVDTREMIKAFIDEWCMLILAAVGGAGGTTVVLAIGKKVLQKIIESLNKTAEANKEGNDTLAKTTEVVTEGLGEIVNKIEIFEDKYSSNFEATNERIRACIDEIEELKHSNAQFKELIALLVASNPQLASNGFATKILEVLDEGSETNE